MKPVDYHHALIKVQKLRERVELRYRIVNARLTPGASTVERERLDDVDSALEQAEVLFRRLAQYVFEDEE